MSPHETTGRPLRSDAVRNRQRIVEAARELFAERGLKPNLNDVAHHAGVGVGTVYRRFATKDDLILAIFEDGLDQLTALAGEALLIDDPWDGFVWFLNQMCEVTATDRGLREIAFSKAFSNARVEEAQHRLGPEVTRLVERAQASGRLRPEVSFSDMPIVSLLAGMVSEFAGHVDADLWRRYVAILLDGMHCQAGQARLPVEALDETSLDAAMRTWEPAQ